MVARSNRAGSKSRISYPRSGTPIIHEMKQHEMWGLADRQVSFWVLYAINPWASESALLAVHQIENCAKKNVDVCYAEVVFLFELLAASADGD